MRLSSFSVLTFDCYGTLIDWEAGLLTALEPLLSRVSPRPSPDAALARFAFHEGVQQAATPKLKYSELLAAVHEKLAREWGVIITDNENWRFGASVPDWPAFPDSPAALKYLKQHYALVILSNVDRASFRRSNQRLDVEFDAVFTAEDIGSYKPDRRNFEYMIARLTARGFGKNDILHTAQSLFHDHAPANAFGLASCWIDRQAGRPGATAAPPEGVRYDFRFPTLAAMAEAHRAEMKRE